MIYLNGEVGLEVQGLIGNIDLLAFVQRRTKLMAHSVTLSAQDPSACSYPNNSTTSISRRLSRQPPQDPILFSLLRIDIFYHFFFCVQVACRPQHDI